MRRGTAGRGRRLQNVGPSIVVPIALTAALAVLLSVGGDAYAALVVDSLTLLGLATYATVCAVLAARSARGRVRAAWSTLAIALGCRATGDAISVIHELVLHRTPVPSVVNAFYLACTVLTAVAMVPFAVEAMRQSRLRMVLDGATVALCLFLLLWMLGFNTVYDTYRADQTELGLAFIYPVVDLVGLTVAVVVLARADRRERGILSLLTIAIALVTISHSAFAYLVAIGRYDSGSLIDIGWAAALVTFAAAALLSRHPKPPMEERVGVPSNSSLWLPYVPLLLAGTIGPHLVMTGLESHMVPLVVVAVCLRQSVAAWENRRLLSVAAERALRDPLTGLANRTLFHDRLAHAMALRWRDDRWVAVISLDLDDFKMVNDSLGHPTADSLLIHVGGRVAACARPGDTVARVGGDEFALLVEGRFDESRLVAQRIVEAFNEPFEVDGQQMLMRPSIGVAVASPSEADLEPETLIRRADVAMYAAKRSRSPEVHTFTSDMAVLDPDPGRSTGYEAGTARGDGAAQVRLLGELRRAIDQGALDVLYQPKVALGTQCIVGVEALLRWPHPLLGTLRPDTFIGLVRQHGLMRPVTDLVLETALRDTAEWVAKGAQIPVAVNLFAPFLRDTELPDTLCRALANHAIPHRLLTVEITEDLVLSEVSLATAVLQRLRTRGIRVAIDDFGSGYSALSYLRDLPIDEVKLDRQFIASVTVDSRAAAVVRAIIDLTHDLGVIVVAEGVEDADTSAWLRDHGCDVGQGFYFGMPVAAAEIPRLVGVPAQT